MKTSNIILLTLFIAGIAWHIVFDSLAVNVANDVKSDKISRYGYSLSEKTLIKPGNFDNLIVHIDGGVKIAIRPGTSNTLYVSDGLDEYLKYSKAGRTLVLEIAQPKTAAENSIILEMNSLKTITTTHTVSDGWTSQYDLRLERLKWPQLQINAQFPNAIEIKDCTFSKLGINSRIQQKINTNWGIDLNADNRIDSLNLDIKGSGNVSLRNCGRNFNQIALSDSVILNASLAVIQKILRQ